MSQFLPGLSRSFKAEADLSAKQFHFVKPGANANEVNVAGAGTDKLLGVLQDKPEAGWGANVMIGGTTKLVAGGAITKGDELTSDANGQAAGAVASDTVRAIALENAASGDIFEALLVYYIK